MAYRHYETEGLIIGYQNLGEASRLYWVLTSDFGLVQVLAQGVRHNKSKLRYHLKNFSFTNLTIIRGREFWRLVGVRDAESLSSNQKVLLLLLKKISLVLRRLVHGEEPNLRIFQDLKQAFSLTSGEVEASNSYQKSLEIFILTRLLADLGYLDIPTELKDIFSVAKFSPKEIACLQDWQLRLTKQINQALEVSHL